MVSPKALARVDLDRTRLSAEVMTNWLAKTQGALTIRPGTKWLGSSLNDTGAEWVEFVAATDDVALAELTKNKMRVWIGSDAHALSLLSRPAVGTTVSLSDTGWSNTSTGGVVATSAVDLIPLMTGATTDGVTITASSEVTSGGTEGNCSAWQVGDDDIFTHWQDTGNSKPSTLPSWLNVDFGSDTGNRKSVRSYSIRATWDAPALPTAPSAWELLTGNYDTGTYATDTGKWTLEDARSGETGWAVSEKRTYELPGNDTGTIEVRRHWRLNVTAVPVGVVRIQELELFDAAAAAQVKLQGSKCILNPTSIGALARREKQVAISDTGTEHALAIYIQRGPVTLRCGSSQRDDDYIRETALGTGYHNLAFTPGGNFWITLQSDMLDDRIVGSLAIADSGTVELTTPWDATDIGSVRYDQSADVVYADCNGVRPSKIERRGTGRSWSVVDYAPDNGPFLATASSSAQMSVSHFFGNTTLSSDRPFFQAGHTGALFRAFHEGQSGQWRLGALDAKTDTVEVTGIADTGGSTPTFDTGFSDRGLTVSVSGTYAGRVIVEKSISTDAETGYKPVSNNMVEGSIAPHDTGTFFLKIVDRDDNVKVRYRARLSEYTSGVAEVRINYPYGGVTGIARITGYNSNTDVDIEVLSRFSDTGATDNWQEGYWSEARSFPSAVALSGGRLAHANGGNLFMSVSDDYENFDDTTKGDAGPLVKTLGSGPVDNIRWLLPKLRLLIGTDGAELALISSSLDEPVTPDNANVRVFATQGSANLRAVQMDTKAIHVQRSRQRVFMIGPGAQGTSFGDYENFELTLLVPDLLAAGVVSVAIQRQPDTRLHCVLGDGTVGILTYEPQEEVLCWSMWETDGAVEKAVVLPGTSEDAVFYHVRRTINGATKRYLEKWALEAECMGDTGLSWLADCAVSQTDTGRSTSIAAPHLAGASVVVWSSDTGPIPGVDRSPDVDGVQTTYTVDTGAGTVTLGTAVHHAVVGLPYQADWKSAKLAYAAEAGTALAQVKRVGQIAFVLYQTHNNGLFFGSDTGHLEPLPRMNEGAVVDADLIHASFDQTAMPFSGENNPDSRIYLRGKAPRPATVMAAIPAVQTNDRV